jgi:YVTN family beta-propeller protein
MDISRRTLLKASAASAAMLSLGQVLPSPRSVSAEAIESEDRVFICNEDSNTMTVIDPRTNTVDTTINFTSFDEDPRPPFRFVTGGVVPTHAAMVSKPLYHGAIALHGGVMSPDSRLLALTGRGSSNVYLVDTAAKGIVGNTPNPQSDPPTNPQRITSGVFVGREPHEPTFSRNGQEIWVAVRGEDRIAVLDTQNAVRASRGEPVSAIRQYLATASGPAQIWFSADGSLAFVAYQKGALMDVLLVNPDGEGYSHPERKLRLDLSAQDPPGFTPFLKSSPDGSEVWLSHKLADAVSAFETADPHRIFDTVPLGDLARPNHIEFVENEGGRAVYVSLARVDDNGPGGVASSQIAIIARDAPWGQRRVVRTFFTHGREAHGLWTNPSGTLLFVAHEQDELPGTPAEGQTVCTAFDVSNPFSPEFIAQIPLGALALPSGALRNKKSINLVYVRPGARSQTG